MNNINKIIFVLCILCGVLMAVDNFVYEISNRVSIKLFKNPEVLLNIIESSKDDKVIIEAWVKLVRNNPTNNTLIKAISFFDDRELKTEAWEKLVMRNPGEYDFFDFYCFNNENSIEDIDKVYLLMFWEKYILKKPIVEDAIKNVHYMTAFLTTNEAWGSVFRAYSTEELLREILFPINMWGQVPAKLWNDILSLKLNINQLRYIIFLRSTNYSGYISTVEDNYSTRCVYDATTKKFIDLLMSHKLSADVLVEIALFHVDEDDELGKRARKKLLNWSEYSDIYDALMLSSKSIMELELIKHFKSDSRRSEFFTLDSYDIFQDRYIEDQLLYARVRSEHE